MAAPTVKEVTPTVTGNAQRAGGIDWNQLVQIIKGTHGSEKIPGAAIEIDSITSAQIGVDAVGDSEVDTHTSTKITITAKGQLNAAIVFNDQANVFGNFDQTFKDNRILIESPDGLTPISIVNLQQTLARNLTIPILTGNRNILVSGEGNIVNADVGANEIDETKLDVAVGAATFVLTSNGVGSAPTFQAVAPTGKLKKLGGTVLSVGGTSLKVDGLSIDLDPSASPTYTSVFVVYNILGNTSRVMTGKINAGTSYRGNFSKQSSGTPTDTTFSTATFPLSFGVTGTHGGSGVMDITVGDRGGVDSLNCAWNWIRDDDLTGYGFFHLITTASTTLTEIELIGSANMAAGSSIMVYGVEI